MLLNTTKTLKFTSEIIMMIKHKLLITMLSIVFTIGSLLLISNAMAKHSPDCEIEIGSMCTTTWEWCENQKLKDDNVIKASIIPFFYLTNSEIIYFNLK